MALRKALSQPLRPILELRVVGARPAASVFSSSTSCGVERTRRISEQLWMVVEQLICPPRKKATVPSALKSGAEEGQFGDSVVGWNVEGNLTGVEQIPKRLSVFLVVEQ